MLKEKKNQLSRQVVVTIRSKSERLLTRIFEQGPIVIGRQPECDLVLDFPFLSRSHCQIQEESGHFFIVDLASRNGISHEGERVLRVSVLEKARVQIQDLTIEVQLLKNLAPLVTGEEAIETVVRAPNGAYKK